MVMPPVSVPVLLWTRLFAICRLCPQACTKMPPPPCEALVTLRPSMLDGLHWKLPGYGLGTKPLAVGVPVPQLFAFKSVASVGYVSLPNGADLGVKFTPFASTVIPAPSYAPLAAAP